LCCALGWRTESHLASLAWMDAQSTWSFRWMVGP